MYTTIPIDFEVYKKLTNLLKDASDSYNSVLRRELRLKESDDVEGIAKAAGAPWVTKGVAFPHGTEFRKNYKGQSYAGKAENGALVVNGKRFTSPSAAAMDITNNSVDGWKFWECRIPGDTKWTLIDNVRKKNNLHM